MTVPAWLPELVLFNDHNGHWEIYLEVLYRHFSNDFIVAIPNFNGRRIALKKHPEYQGKEATFWHLISSGNEEEERLPDLRRCERIRWPRSLIDNHPNNDVLVWSEPRYNEQRIHLWVVHEDYVLVLADRKEYVLLWTAFYVEREHYRQKLRKRFAAAQKG